MQDEFTKTITKLNLRGKAIKFSYGLPYKYHACKRAYLINIQNLKKDPNYCIRWFYFNIFHCSYPHKQEIEAEILEAQPNFRRSRFKEFEKEYNKWLDQKDKVYKIPDNPTSLYRYRRLCDELYDFSQGIEKIRAFGRSFKPDDEVRIKFLEDKLKKMQDAVTNMDLRIRKIRYEFMGHEICEYTENHDCNNYESYEAPDEQDSSDSDKK